MNLNPKTHLVRGLNKQGTRVIRVELAANDSADAMQKVRAEHPDAGDLACRLIAAVLDHERRAP